MEARRSEDLSVERATQNELRFREANARIHQVAEDLEIDGAIPFVCECEQPDCRRLVRLGGADYARARASPRHFVLATGHPYRSGRIVAEGDGWMIVEKSGEAGRIAEQHG